ncbi:MAG: NAD(P)/FAD-dependent oxidoreductase [Clostridia bacterium]|nr:NAD(P)/FAD-dependent oxidoreductase [Clostridia bacterium]
MKIIIVGAGAAGLMAAGISAMADDTEVLLFERNQRPARKLLITGKGRCNVTNACSNDELIEAVYENGRFLYSAFNAFTSWDTMELFEQLGVPLKIERGQRVFPTSDKAVDIVDALVKFALKKNVKLINKRVESLIFDNDCVAGVVTEDKAEYTADKVIIATGGKSYPLTGSTGDGYKLARQAGHSVVTPRPSLVPFEIKERCCKDMQGLSLKNVAIRVYDRYNGKDVYTDFGEMLFTHFGISGPVVLSASSHIKDMEPGRYEFIIDLKPALDEQQLDARIRRDFDEQSNKIFANSLSKLLPSKIIPAIIEYSGISAECRVNQITREMRASLVKALKEFRLTIKGFRPIDEAIITSGGVKTSEISPKTMESKIVNGLYFAGEVIDVSAYTGGFNLQIAFSTGYLAGKSSTN